MKVKFISLASGSSGNCYYIGTEKYGILIDAGIAVRTIKKSLKEVGVGMERYVLYSSHTTMRTILRRWADWVRSCISLSHYCTHPRGNQ